MEFMFVISKCVACNTLVSYNPEAVPSLRVNGSREPLCFVCFTRWNEIHRIAKGLEPVKLNPEAYDPRRCDL
jgi:hypothetical protein